MRIVIDYTPAIQQRAGIGRHTRELIQALLPLVDRHEIILLVFGRYARPRLSAEMTNCRWRFVPLPHHWLTVAWHRLRLPLPVNWMAGPMDLFHATDFVLPPLRRARTLVTVHDLSFLTVPECADAGLRAYLQRVVPRSVVRADHVLADSQNTRTDLIRLLQVPPAKITVVYPGVETRFRPDIDPVQIERVRARYGLGDRPFVLGLSRLEPRKNFAGLIRAWAIMRRKSALPHRLVIAGGKGWLYDEIYQTARASQLRDDIVFAGFVADADLPALYTAADIFAFPSLYEGFGIPILEALACGTPVVCTNNSSLPEAAGDAALLVDTGDDDALAVAMRRLIEDDELRTTLRERGLAHARRFTWEAAARQLLAAYERVGRHA